MCFEQSRVSYNLRKQGREKLTDYIKELYEEVICMAISGARGIGGEIQHFDTTYTGYPNALRAPDAAHLYVGKAGDKAKATLVQADTLALTTINKLRTKAKKMLGGQPDKAVKMTPISMGGKKVFCLATPPECIHDIRDDLGTTVLLVEHDMNLIMNISDRILALNFGERVAEGLPEEIQRHPEVLKAYLGEEDKVA